MSFAYLASTPGLKFNYSLYAVPTAWVLGMAPLWWAIGAAEKAKPGLYNNAEPKESWENVGNAGLNPALAKRIGRAKAASDNSLINLGFFAGSLAAANAAHVPSRFLHICAGAYLTVRSVYNLAYIFIDDPAKSYLRTVCFLSGVGSCLALCVRAAQANTRVPW